MHRTLDACLVVLCYHRTSQTYSCFFASQLMDISSYFSAFIDLPLIEASFTGCTDNLEEIKEK